MRKLLLSLSCIATLYGEQMYLYEVSSVLGVMENGKSTGMNSSLAYGLQLQYNDIDFFIKPELSYVYSPKIGLHESDATVSAHTLMFNGVYDVEYTALLTPFLKAGAGYQSISNNALVNTDSFLMSTGAGLKLNIKEQFSIKFETLVTWHDFHESNILVFGGLNFSFGYEDNVPAASTQTSEPLKTEPDQAIIVTTPPVTISKEDHNLTQTKSSNSEVSIRDTNGRLDSMTLFIPYLFRSYELDEESKTVLKGYANELRAQKSLIKIIGHTDTKGRRAFNQELSLKRASTVKDLFVEHGVSPERITVEGRGESEPMADSQDPVADKFNKRIEIKVQY
ncbi:MAG: OmpA family protein [Campylobacterota bacterium]